MKSHKPHILAGITFAVFLAAILLYNTAAQAAILREVDTATIVVSPTPPIVSDTIADVFDSALNLTRSTEPTQILITNETVPIFTYPEAILWDNGPLVTHPGGGLSGADASALQTANGMNTLGFGNQFPLLRRMADDFEITDPAGWQIENITFFAYQTDALINPSTITGVYCQIWDGPPNNPGSSIIWGNLSTNRLVSSTWSNTYRVPDDDLLMNNRPIMANKVSAEVTLQSGIYWLDWTTAGSLSSGPWAPSISILGQTTSGNALQYTTSWEPALDSGTNTAQGMPFIIEGVILTEPDPPDFVINLPLLLNNFPFTPPPPFLNPIDNEDGDGSYTISWSASEGADTYTLQEDDNADFSTPTTVYSGASTTNTLSSRDVGTYYYRVNGSNAYASSDWSNVESVEVTVPLPDCPQAGAWSGTTSQGRAISFEVENSPQCRIAANSLRIAIRDSCYYNTTTTFSSSYSITNNHFDTGGISVRVAGDFSSTSAAGGTFSMYMANPFPPPYNCTASGTWTATP